MALALTLTLALTLALAYFVVQFVRRLLRRFPNTTYDTLLAASAQYDAEAEDQAARYRLTAGRLAKATAALGDGKFDCVCIGSGPGSMGCAAALARLGKRCCVLEQGEELGGGAHIRSHTGPTNARLVLHYGVDVPDGVRLRVASTWRSFRPRRCTVLDDSFEHEVRHLGRGDRATLVVQLRHPSLQIRDSQ